MTSAQIALDANADTEQFKLAIARMNDVRQRQDIFANLYHGEWAAEQAIHSEDPYAYARMAARCVWSVLPVLRGEDR